jgi:gamma-glutamyltranspeptidase/glutathione hydrolase
VTGVRGAVAAGDGETARAAADVLRDGGNAYDAALCGLLMACVAEPVLCSLGGGGFLLAAPAASDPVLYDFFCQTPKRRLRGDEVDFLPVHADFGPQTQEFHIGMGAVAVPGVPAGLFAVHGDLGRLPMRRIAEPAIAAARAGVALSPLQSFILEAVAPIFRWSGAARALYDSPGTPGQTLRPGDVVRLPGLADLLDAMAGEGADLFYRGVVAREIVEMGAAGGAVRADDLAGYRVERRRPLARRFAGADIAINPAPSSGGPLIDFALALAQSLADNATDEDWLTGLAHAMEFTNQARRDAGLIENCDDARVARLLSQDFMADYFAQIAGLAAKPGGTTHISVIDGEGNAAALSVSNGEGCGHLLPTSGVMLNNMLGEEDLNPDGFFRWQPDARITSMMAPTAARTADGRLLVLGSGGSNRIRSAILQVLTNLLSRGMALGASVEAPRIHYERGLLNIEAGHAAKSVDALTAAFPEHQVWPDRNFFFGGVHAVLADPATGTFEAAGDPRRGGHAIVLD